MGTTIEFRAGALMGPVAPRLMTIVGVLAADAALPGGWADFYWPMTKSSQVRVALMGKLAPGVFLTAVVVVFIIVCANVANLLLARGTARRREIGVRMALGAQRIEILPLVLRKGLILTTMGIAAAGLAAAALGSRALQGLLFGIMPLDPTTYIAVSLLFGLVATLACCLPARRATKVDALVALRSE